jgi:hypothetical protein
MEGVIDQSYQNFEPIYLDDAWTDDSAAVFEEWRSRTCPAGLSGPTDSVPPLDNDSDCEHR